LKEGIDLKRNLNNEIVMKGNLDQSLQSKGCQKDMDQKDMDHKDQGMDHDTTDILDQDMDRDIEVNMDRDIKVPSRQPI
jgi:hypothetical protein